MRQFQKELSTYLFLPKLTYQILLKYLAGWKSYFKEFNAETCLEYSIY